MKRRKRERILYLDDFAEARLVRDQFPGSRIVRFERGYAIQLEKSGPYVVEEERLNPWGSGTDLVYHGDMVHPK